MEDSKEKLPVSTDPNPDGPDPLSIDIEIWLMAEHRIQEILYVVQPNIVSDKRRKEVINYVRQLINGYFGTEVLAFGSVPLKTYLPDGDVDLTAFCYQSVTETFAKEVCNALKSEEGPEFRVKDIQYIDAQVKVVKGTVKGTAVDISFNQVSGLCTLYFLEQADQLIGRDHLFKRSILLIKAWCYYESRLLGAHHGLLSTYALEIMVLIVISLYHESLRGPLEVLYRFLEYYSQFDWKNYCATMHGPVKLSSFAEGNTETTEGDGKGTLLSKEFLQNCRDIFANAIKAHECEVHEFIVKYFNILDPLKETNNLGRSVSMGSHNRIVPAFALGLRKLRKILALPGEMMGEGLEKYFECTLDRNGRGERPDLLVPVPAFGTGKCELFDLTGDSDSYYGSLQYALMYNSYTYVWDENTLTWTVQPVQNGFVGMALDVYVPAGTFYDPNQPAADCNLSRPWSSRGTGTYIPVNYSAYKDAPNWGENNRNFNPTQQGLWLKSIKQIDRADGVQNPSGKDGKEDTPNWGENNRNFNPTQQGLWLKSDQQVDRADRVQNPPGKDGKEDSSPLDLSLESFPHLQGTTKSPSEISQMGYGSSPSTFGFPSQVTHKPADGASPSSILLSTQEAIIAGEKEPELAQMNSQKGQELQKITEETNPRQFYELEDKKDFPPLSS